MKIAPFTPNYLKGKSYDKNGTKETPEPAKKRTCIEGAIKEVADVPQALEKAIKGTRKAGRPKGSKNKAKRGIV